MTQSRVGRRWLGVFVTLLIAAPAIAAVIALAGRRWYPTDDFAIIDLRVRDVFTANTPLTGLYSRPGWNHPGPLMFWVIAPLSWVTGHAPWATRVGGALLQAVALVWLGVATARRGLRWLLAAGVVTSLTYLASNQWLFREPWNLHIPLPWFLLFLFVTCFASLGEFRQFIAMSVAATVIVSTHLGYAPLIVAGFAYAILWTLVDVRRGRAPVAWRSTVGICAAVWVLTWIAPFVDILIHWPGNLGKIGRYFVGGGHASVGFADALKYVADTFAWVPPWVGGTHRLAPITGFAVAASIVWLLVPVVLVLVGTLAVRRTRDRTDARVLGLSVVMLVVGIVAISGADEPRSYTFAWRATVAAFLAVAVVWSVATAVEAAAGERLHVARGIAVVVAVLATAWGSIAMTTAVVRRPSTLLATREGDLAAVVESMNRSPNPAGPVRVRSAGSSLPSLFDGVVNELDRRGADVRVDPPRGRIFGSRRTMPEARRANTWYVSEVGSKIPGLLARPGARLLWSVTPLTLAEEQELARIQAKIGAQLDAAGRGEAREFLDSSLVGFHINGVPGIASLDVVRLGQLNAKVERAGRCRCAIVEVSRDGEYRDPVTGT